METTSHSSGFAVWLWLLLVALLVAAMVIVGGATRLTDSGLSITEWQPLLGAIPPLTEQQWLVAFDKYKLIPEYQIQNRGMSLGDFKAIFWWEWAHRFLGRFIGFVFLAPLVFFVATGRITRRLWLRLLVIFVLGGLQGALGWYMVSSGLTERTDVSQYRLAAHLSLAVALFAAITWTMLGLASRRQWQRSGAVLSALVFLVLVFVQIALGGFVAGLDAGHAAADWPTMNGQMIPEGLWSQSPAWRNLFENATTVHFFHRVLAYGIFIYGLFMARAHRRGSGWLIVLGLCVQVTLGIATVLGQVPLSTALMHQGGALLVVAFTLWHLHGLMITRVPVPDRR